MLCVACGYCGWRNVCLYLAYDGGEGGVVGANRDDRLRTTREIGDGEHVADDTGGGLKVLYATEDRGVGNTPILEADVDTC